MGKILLLELQTTAKLLVVVCETTEKVPNRATPEDALVSVL